ncbi:MAG: hypothetical protein FJZ12_00650 [Candidatus Omnitrophica bacterium]|nr:hypothetical protein [Candidatus Omnitrophota bacterium]
MAKCGLLFNSILILSCLAFSGCTSSTHPTYPKENIEKAIEDICKQEYNTDIKVRLVGSTLWVYLPIPEGILEKADKPQKFIERFAIDENRVELKNNTLTTQYLVKPVPEEEKLQDMKYSKEAFEKINNVWKALRRVIFSMEDPQKSSPKFFSIIVADIKNGFYIKELFYYLDFKKVSYGLISWGEYQHRAVQETEILPNIIGDFSGSSIEYKDIEFEDFIIDQIKHRIKLKFQKPEAEKNADIDKEVLKIIRHTLSTYGFKDFSVLQMDNLLTGKKVLFNRTAALAPSND